MRLVNNILLGTKAVGIEIHYKQDGTCELRYCLLEKKKDKIVLIDSGKGLSSLVEVFELIKENLQYSVLIHGKGIISKEAVDSMQLNFLFGGKSIDGFFIQNVETSAGQNFIAFARQTFIDDLVAQFQSSLKSIRKIFLGPFITSEYFQSIKRPIQMGDYTIDPVGNFYQRSDKASFADSGFLINVENIELESEILPAFAAAIQTLKETNKITQTSQNQSLISLQKNFKQKLGYRRISIGLLIFFFLVLLFNFFYFETLRKNNKELQNRISGNELLIDKLSKLKQDITDKEKLIQVNSLQGKSRLSYYLDQALKLMPTSLTLNNVDLNPPELNRKSETAAFTFKNGIFTISGNTSESIDLNNWVKNLKKYQWVKDVTIDEYKILDDSKIAEFNLVIRLN